MSREISVAEMPQGSWTAYRTVGIEVAVEFADHPQTVVTLEGPVTCKVGDAIVTGVLGERWPVSKNAFYDKYEPAEDRTLGYSGKYKKRIRRVHAIQLAAPFDVVLTGGRGSLHGETGDWCVRFGPDDMAIVGKDIFLASYELDFSLDPVSVYVAIGEDIPPIKRESVLSALDELRQLVPHTRVAVIDESTTVQLEAPIWFRVVNELNPRPHRIPEIVELPIRSLIGDFKPLNLLVRVASAKTESVGKYSLRRLDNVFSGFFSKQETDSDLSELLAIVAEQLTEVDRFNGQLANEMGLGVNESYYLNRALKVEPEGLARTHRIGAVADHLASDYQKRWQRLLLATTNEIAVESDKTPVCAFLGVAKLLMRPTLVSMGLLAALGLASFSELSSGCAPDDPFVFLGCASESWKHWFGPVSFFAVYLFTLGVAWTKYARAKAEKWEARHQDYRLLAEALRVLYVRTILERSVCVGGDLPTAEPAASAWVRLALRSIFHTQPKRSVTGDALARVSAAKVCFIEDQLNYHKEKLLKHREAAIELISDAGRWGSRLFLGVLLVLTVNVFGDVFHYPILSEMGHHFVLIAMVAGLAFWGAMRKVIDSFAWEQEIQRGVLVQDALQQVSQTSDAQLVYDAAEFFLMDQAAWHALHRSRPIEAATGA